MNKENLDDLKALKAKHKTSNFSNKQLEDLRNNVKKIVIRKEEEDKKIRRAEMERLYESSIYA